MTTKYHLKNTLSIQGLKSQTITKDYGMNQGAQGEKEFQNDESTQHSIHLRLTLSHQPSLMPMPMPMHS